MPNSLLKIHSYFRASQHYFWHWAEEGEIVEWQDGDTLCYRDDLSDLLYAIQEQGLPPMGTILLLLGACQGRSLGLTESLLKNCVTRITREDQMHQTLLGFVVQAIEFLELVQALPLALRRGTNRIHLLNTLVAKIPNKIPAANTSGIVASLQNGQWDDLFVWDKRRINIKILSTDLENLCYLYNHFQTTEELQQLLETGLQRQPRPQPVEEETAPIDLLSTLANDPRTLGVARLTKRILAALRIPMRTTGANDLPLGGVSDITNRGDLDRLLISELAQDQERLSARLLNNEALYIRREEPPNKSLRERVLFLDQTIRMWGIPRLFSFSVALAFGQKKQGITKFSAWGMSGEEGHPLDLSTQSGVMAAMQQLHPDLHCGYALERSLQTVSEVKENQEVIFITEARSFEHPAFQKAFTKVRSKINFVALLNRRGQLQWYQYHANSRKLLRAFQFDLDDLLLAPATKPILDPDRPTHLPLALRLNRFPLRFPALQLNYRREYTFQLPDSKGVLCVTPDHRVLLWGGKGWQMGKAAIEVIPSLEYGDYHFGFKSPSTLFLLVRQASVLQLYTVLLNSLAVQKSTIPLDTVNAHFDVVYTEDGFQLFNYSQQYLLDTGRGVLENKQPSHRDQNRYRYRSNSEVHREHDAPKIKSMVNSGYSILSKIKRIYVDEKGNLCLNDWFIALQYDTLRLEQVEQGIAKYRAPKIVMKDQLLKENQNVFFGTTEWADGSQAIVDSRGFVHLKSSDAKIPEITLVTALNMPLTFWTSTGQYCGANTFIPAVGKLQLLTPRQLYNDILKPFIENLK